jgi:hypothetical protein
MVVRCHWPPAGDSTPSSRSLRMTSPIVAPSAPIMRKIRRTTPISGSLTTRAFPSSAYPNP